jgi:serine/threonine-protein kinase
LRGAATRASDIYASAIVLWELLTGERLFASEDPGIQLAKLIERRIEPPSRLVPELEPAIDALVMRGLELEPDRRYASAREMARAIERVIGVLPPAEVGEWVEALAPNTLADRIRKVAEIESSSSHALTATERTMKESIPVEEGPTIAAMALGETERSSGTLDRIADRSRAVGNEDATVSELLSEEVRRRGRTRRFIAGLALAVLVTSAGFAIVHIRRAAAPSNPSSTETNAAPGRAELVESRPAAAVSAPSSVVPPASSADKPVAAQPTTRSVTAIMDGERSPSAPAIDGARSTSAVSRPSPRHALRPSNTAALQSPSTIADKTAPKSVSDCSVPFTIDSEGIRHPKPECL